jgi:hypothetical protein
MKKSVTLMVMGIMLVSLVLSGCGGGTTVQSNTRTTTLGQELMDLEKAYKSGIISEKEYKSTREKLLKGK